MARSPRDAPHALLAGGGSGGHVFPALAVAAELLDRGWRVSYAGNRGAMEERLVTARGLPFHPLAARPLLGRGAFAKAGSLATLARSAASAARLLRRLGADVVLGTGGYVSAPAVVGAGLVRKPALLLEPNARSGVANRWLSRFAREAALGFPSAAVDLRCPTTVTGVPVRAAFFAVPAEVPPGLPGGLLRLLVLGGSQGARQINRLLPQAAALLLARHPHLSIVHQAGEGNVDEVRKAYAAALSGGTGAMERVEVVPFLDDVAAAMASSHLLLSRAGAITVAEICAASRPALFLPLAIAQAHQVDNARRVAEAGAGALLTPEEADAERLSERLSALLANPEALAAMGRAARSLARPDAARAIADRLAHFARAGEAG